MDYWIPPEGYFSKNGASLGIKEYTSSVEVCMDCEGQKRRERKVGDEHKEEKDSPRKRKPRG